ncbi:hypothetical protein HX783_03150 [Pseudomonas sp. D2002]|nr:hypothetical protein [Pseudomonas sp. D2002]NWA81761.1 hypothetical protein [Pseudomonas sp. D2002]
MGVLTWLETVGAKPVRAHRVQGLFAVEEVQQCGIEQRRVLQEGEVAGVRQNQQPGAGNGRGDVLGVFALDRFVMVAVHHQDRGLDARQTWRFLFCSEKALNSSIRVRLENTHFCLSNCAP